MRKNAWLRITLLLMVIFVSVAALTLPKVCADEMVQLQINGQPVYSDVPSYIHGGYTLVPLRLISEYSGALVEWNAGQKMVTISADAGEIRLYIGQQLAEVNGRPVQMEIAAEITNNRTMVPLRFIMEALQAEVDWDAATRTALITLPDAQIAEPVDSTDNSPLAHLDTAHLDTDADSSAKEGKELKISDFQNEVVRLINLEREKDDLLPLGTLADLDSAAGIRAVELLDTFVNDRLDASSAHKRPDGSSCFTVLDAYSFDYYSAGENVAVGQKTPAEVMESWMNSPGHRSNILGDFSHVGIGMVEADHGFAWVQLFIKN